MSEATKKALPLGATVTIRGTVVGDSRRVGRQETVLVQFTRKGRSFEDWFFAEDLSTDQQDGGGI